MDQIQSLNEVYRNSNTQNYLTPEAIYEELIPNKELDFNGALALAEDLQLDILNVVYPDAIVDYTPYRDWKMVWDELSKEVDNCTGLVLDPETDRLFLVEKHATGVDVLSMHEVFSEKDVDIDLPKLLTELNAYELANNFRDSSAQLSDELER